MRLVISTRAEIGRRPIAISRSCSHCGDGPFLTLRISRPTNSGQAVAVSGVKSNRTSIELGKRPAIAAISARLQLADANRRQVARHAAHAQAIGAVGRDGNVDDGVVEAQHLRERLPDRRIRRQIDDALVLVAQAHLARRAQHALRRLPANAAFLEQQPGAGNGRADGREHALHAGARVGRPAHDLQRLLAGVDEAHAQAIGVGMRLRFNNVPDDERRELGRRGLRRLPAPARSSSACR